jgi:hypothetical protein
VPDGSPGIGAGGGAGIGGGKNGSSGDVKIQGGTVAAIKSTSGPGIGDGQGGSGGTFTTGGGNPLIKPVIFTGSISDTVTDAASLTPANGILGALTMQINHFGGRVVNLSITLNISFTVPAGAVMDLPEDVKLWLTSPISLTNYGLVINRISLDMNNSTLTNYGQFENRSPIGKSSTLTTHGHFINQLSGGITMRAGGTLNNYGQFENYSYVGVYSGGTLNRGNNWIGNP